MCFSHKSFSCIRYQISQIRSEILHAHMIRNPCNSPLEIIDFQSVVCHGQATLNRETSDYSRLLHVSWPQQATCDETISQLRSRISSMLIKYMMIGRDDRERVKMLTVYSCLVAWSWGRERQWFMWSSLSLPVICEFSNTTPASSNSSGASLANRRVEIDQPNLQRQAGVQQDSMRMRKKSCQLHFYSALFQSSRIHSSSGFMSNNWCF